MPLHFYHLLICADQLSPGSLNSRTYGCLQNATINESFFCTQLVEWVRKQVHYRALGLIFTSQAAIFVSYGEFALDISFPKLA